MRAATEMLRQWAACGKGDLLAGLHGHLCKALAAVSLAAALAGRAVPLAWACYGEGELPCPMPRLVRRLLRRVD